MDFQIGQNVVFVSGWGERINGAITIISDRTGRPTQMRRSDNGKLKPMMGGTIELAE